VQSELAASVAVAAVSVSLAAAVAELVPTALNLVVPHPDDIVGVPSIPKLNVGNTNAIVSPDFIWVFRANEYETGTRADV